MMLSQALVNYVNALRGVLKAPKGAEGEILTRTSDGWGSTPLMVPAGIVEDDNALTYQQGQEESFEDVFTTWKRIARVTVSETNDGVPYNQTGDSYHDEGYPEELDTWSFDSANNQIVCTKNTVSLAGFLSPDTYDEYVLEARLQSDNGDNDFIGLCIAHAVDEQGRAHTLTAMRQLNGEAPLMIERNRWAFTAAEYNVATVYSGLKWPDGSVAAAPGPNGTGGWVDFPSGCLLKVERAGDIITVSTSQIGEDTYHSGSVTTIDLSSDPQLEVFRGPQRFGYVCISQPNSTWEILQRPGSRVPIIDSRDFSWYVFEDGQWVQKGSDLASAIAGGVLVPNRMHYNAVTGRWYILHDDTLYAI